jgi:ABC-type Na+ transport system ATPase subunit NatA
MIPPQSMDVLREVRSVKAKGRPYVVVFVGVNGVGKSTSLSKICFYLKQQGLKVLLAACDTFRSGAVEQLKTHAARLDVPVYEKVSRPAILNFFPLFLTPPLTFLFLSPHIFISLSSSLPRCPPLDSFFLPSLV